MSNLPHALTGRVLEKLEVRSNLKSDHVPERLFKRALVATHETDTQVGISERFLGLSFTLLWELGPNDFSPPQPFGSRLYLVVPHAVFS